MCKNNLDGDIVATCKRCGQTSFTEMHQPCEHCRKAVVKDLDDKLNSGDIDKIVIVLQPGDDNGSDAEIYCPVYEFLDSTYRTEWDGDTYNMEEVQKAIDYYNENSYDSDLAFDRFADIDTMLPKEEDREIVKCTEYDMPFFTGSQQYTTGEFYSTPWNEEAEDNHFCSWHAMDCYEGSIYSKDFAYFHCEDCNRHVCEQNPANGYMSQSRFVGDCTQVCLSCLQKQILEGGIESVDYRDEDQIFAMWFNHTELADNDFEEYYDYQIGQQYNSIGKDKEEEFIDMINRLGSLGIAVAVDIDSMSICGGGGFGTVYVKTDKHSVEEIGKLHADELIKERELENGN